MHPKRLESRILKSMNRANREFGLIREGDRILVALSGGKDSYGLLWGLRIMQAAAPFRFDLVGYHLDQGQPGHDTSPIENHLKSVGLPYEIEYQDTYTRVVEKTEAGKIYCSLCSRFRRAILYKAAIRHDCNKVALGHHGDDIVETLLLNLFFSGQIKTMPPLLQSDDGHHQIIRPLCYVPESELVELAAVHEFPVVPCNLCGSLEAQRKAVKKLLQELSAQHPRLKSHILAATGNVRTTHLLDKSVNPLFAHEGASHSMSTLDTAFEEELDDACGGVEPASASSLIQIGGARSLV